MGEEEVYTDLTIGTTFRLTKAGFVAFPLINDGEGNYRQIRPILIEHSGVTIGEYLGTDAQVRKEWNAPGKTSFIEAYGSLLFRPTDDFVTVLGLTSQRQYFLIALNYDCAYFLEPA